MADLNDGKPYHVTMWNKGVPPVWPQAQEGDRVKIHNGKTIKEYEYRSGEWHVRSTAYVR